MTTSPCALPAPLPLSLFAAWVLAAAGLLAAFASHAQVHDYRIDPVHTRVMFGLDHAGFSTALGTVSGSTGWLAFDPSDWSSARVDVEIPLDRIDLGNDDWNHAAKRMLDTGRYPGARFVSTSIAPVDASHAAICGTLTLHGVPQPLCLQAKFNQLKRAPMPPFRQTAGFSATTTLLRGDFGINDWQSMVGNMVELRIEVEAVRDGSAPQPEQVPEPRPAPESSP